jgi:hypothetical protein
MSIEPEDMLEQALRGDLPTPATEARLRRRLLAAGVAVGHGVATTTAAAAGAGGMAAKLAGLSWGLKLGLAAAVAIPTVGLLLDGGAEPPRAAQAPVVAAARPAPVTANARPIVPSPDAPSIAAAEPVAPTPERSQPHLAKAPGTAATPPSDVAAAPAHPSQADFAAPAAPARAPQVGSTLAEETRLLDGAFAELTAGNLGRAAALIHEHEARFPAGLLQRERERAKTRLSEMSRGE